MSYADYLSRFPGRAAFLRLFNFETAEDLDSGSAKDCREVTVGGVIKAATHVAGSGHVYIRLVDFTLEGPSCTQDHAPRDLAIQRLMRNKAVTPGDPDKTLKADINNFVGAIIRVARQSKASSQILSTYRQELSDPLAELVITMKGKSGAASRRCNGPYIAVDLLPYAMSRLGFYDIPPDPRWTLVWQAMKKMELIGTCGLDDARQRHGGPTSVQAQRRQERRRRLESAPVPDESEDAQEGRPGRAPLPPPQDAAVVNQEQDQAPLNPDEVASEYLMQLRRPKLVDMIRYYRKTIVDLREQNARLQAQDSEQGKDLREDLSKIRHKLKRAREENTHLRNKITMAERCSASLASIKAALDDNLTEYTPATCKAINSYRSLYGPMTKEEYELHAKNREYDSEVKTKLLDATTIDRMNMRKQLASLGAVISRQNAEVQTILTADQLDTAQQIHKELQVVLEKEKEKSRSYHIPSLKGREAEDRILELLVAMAPVDTTVLLTRTVGHCGDYMLLQYREDVVISYSIIDCKSYTGPVPVKEVEKLKNDVDSCTKLFGAKPSWAAIISLESDIIYGSKSGAADFLHEGIPVFLLHSACQRGDNGSSAIRDMLGRAELMSTLLPQPVLSLDSSREIEVYAKRLKDTRKQGRGRSHSQARSRVSFGSAVTKTHECCLEEKSAAAPEVLREESEGAEDDEPSLERLEVVLDSVPVEHYELLDPRIFIEETSMTTPQRNIARFISRNYQYSEGQKMKGKALGLELTRPLGLSYATLRNAFMVIFIPQLRQGHWIHNIWPK